jgi:rod shape-determining protein MreD
MGSALALSTPILALLVILQSSALPLVRVQGGLPDLILLYVLVWASDSELDEALAIAIIGGILQDLLSAAPVGTSSLGLVLIAFGVRLVASQLYRVGYVLLLGGAFISTFVKEGVAALVMLTVGYRFNAGELLTYVMLPSAVYNMAALIVFYVIVRGLQAQLRPTLRSV